MNQEQFNNYQLYRGALANLNEQQRRAVESTEGPLMVVAGPGTGKTQILGLRVAHIIHQGLARPDEILCITFTNLGAAEMRERICQFVGDKANLSVFTFHGFCQYLLQEYAHYFTRGNFRLWNDWEQINFFRNFMRDKVQPGHILRNYYNIYQEISNLQHHWLQMDMYREFFFRKNGLNYMDFLEQFMDGLEQNPEFQYKRTVVGKYKQGQPKIHEIKKKRTTLRRTLEACKLYSLFKAEQFIHKFNGFQDLINEVLDLLLEESEPAKEILSNLQERYQYILVDEFQDTNEEQYRIVKLLSGFWGKNSNIFIVGDRNQSIYAFQGARETNIHKFQDDFITNQEQIITLINNYRSKQPILDLAYNLLDDNSNLPLQAVKSDDISEPVIIWQEYTRAKENYLLVGQRILALRERNIPWGNIAILYPKHRIGEDMERLLGPMGIPFRSRKAGNILHNPLIKYWLQILSYVLKTKASVAASEQLNLALLHMLYSQSSIVKDNLKMQHIWELWADYFNAAPNNNSERNTSLLNYIIQTPKWDQFLAIAKSVQDCLQLDMEDLVKFLDNSLQILDLQQFLPSLKVRNPLFAQASLFSKDLETFREFVLSCIQEKADFSLEDLLTKIIVYINENISIESNIDIEKNDAVLLLSLHACKGQEYEHVFMIGNEKSLWLTGTRVGYSIEPWLGGGLAAFGQIEDEKERQHLLYVGITRAKSKLYIHYPYEDSYINKDKLCQKSLYVQHLSALSEEEYAQAVARYNLQNIDVHPTLASEKDPKTQSIWRVPMAYQNVALCDRYRYNFVLSYSALEIYLRCPLNFYAKYILRLPEQDLEFSGAADLGKLTHELIRNIWNYAVLNHSFPTYSHCLAILTNLNSESVSVDVLHALNKRLDVLYHYLQQQMAKYLTLAPGLRNFKMEQKYQVSLPSSIQLSGFLDLNVNNRLIVDYKTQQKLELKQNLADPLLRQALFYRILLENTAGHTPDIFIFAHIQEEEVKEWVLEFTNLSSLISEYKQLLKETYWKIRNRIFSFADNTEEMEACGECSFCKSWNSEFHLRL